MAALLCLPLGSCGNSVDGRQAPADAAPASKVADAAPLREDDGGDRPGRVASSCPGGQFATGFDEAGRLRCDVIDTVAKEIVNQQCTLFVGWRDSCDGCTDDPSKWGRVSASDCANGAGTDNTCTIAALGTSMVQLFGLNTDGDVGGDDKFYLGFHCADVEASPVAASTQCEDESYLSAVREGDVECVSARALVSRYARESCQLYLGWRDNCEGCTTAPAKLGRTGSIACANEGGADNTCTNATLSGTSLALFGLNTDGDVNGDDKFYVGFRCAGAIPSFASVESTCPIGSLVTAVLADGTLECTDPAAAAQAAIVDGCNLYYGWQDNCDGCTSPPTKWGRSGGNDCENGLGANNTCTQHEVGGASVTMFGLNTAGDVNGDDTFYTGFRCQ